ncbi:hypothetical protein [Vibrio bivalvicida]|uniref:HTTM domain-containing protein n=1 Tax=Vibrio bivalvicida TaxID=1276888 RepID=A0ABV4MP87_9VIBR
MSTFFRVSVCLVITFLLVNGPYGPFVSYVAGVTGSSSSPMAEFLGDNLQTIRWLSILLALVSLFSSRYLYISTTMLAISFGLLNWYCSISTPGGLWNFNSHLNFFMVAIALVEVRKRFWESNDTFTKQVVYFCQFYVAVFYFQSGISKLLHTGVTWLDGRTALLFALEMGTEFGAFLANYPWIYSLGSVIIVGFEILFLPLFLIRAHLEKLVIGAMLLHLSVYLTMDISFWHMWLLFPALFWEDLKALAKSKPKLLPNAA